MQMNEQYQQEEERENLSGADDFEAWVNSMENSYICPYRFGTKSDPTMCCGEMHMRKASDMTKEEKEEMK